MKSQYIKSGSAHFALNFKAATSSIARAIVSAHYPDIEDNLINNTSYPEGLTVDNSRWHSQLPKTETPDGDVILIVRDPVERFRSACVETGKTPDEALSEQGQKNNHFWPTSRLLVDGCKLYRFESDLDAAATSLGLSLPLPNIDGGNGEKPTLTPEQLAQVQAIYADDIALYESITEAGQVWVAPEPEPEPEPVPQSVTPRQIRLALIDRGIMPEQITQMLSAIDDELLRAKSLAEWEYASIVKRDHSLISQLGTELEFNSEDVDDLFREANAIGE